MLELFDLIQLQLADYHETQQKVTYLVNLTIKASLAPRYILFLLKGPKGPSVRVSQGNTFFNKKNAGTGFRVPLGH